MSNLASMILVLTSTFDEHADILCPRLEGAGASVFRLNTDQWNRYQIGLTTHAEALSLIDQESEHRIVGSDIKSVWYRRPSIDKSHYHELDADSAMFYRGETKELVKSLALALPHAFWVTSPHVLYVAKVKFNQLAVASQAGLWVPKTLITRDAILARAFFDSCPNGIVAKSLKVPYIESAEAYFALRTQTITRADLDDQSLFISPVIFQERIWRTYELRIVAVGRTLFAFKAVSNDAGSTDIRTSGPENIRYTPVDVSSALRVKILEMLRRFDLPFSSMDLLVDEQDREWFVDLNPNGQWLWLDPNTDLGISDAFVQMLASGLMP